MRWSTPASLRAGTSVVLTVLAACRAASDTPDARANDSAAPDDTSPDTADSSSSASGCPGTLLFPEPDAVASVGAVTFVLDSADASGTTVRAVRGDDPSDRREALVDDDGRARLRLDAGVWHWSLTAPGCDEARALAVAVAVPGDSLVVSDADIRERAPHAERVVAHLMGWFGHGGHLDVGYASDDPAVAARQVAAARARGIRGFVVDAYGGLSPEIARAYAEVLAAADASNTEEIEPFEVAYMYDYGALRWGAPDPHDRESVTTHMIEELRAVHAASMAEGAPHAEAYLRVAGRPVLFTFAYADVAAPDLARVRAALDALSPSPLLVDLNPDTEASPWVDGWYSWINFEGGDGAPYLRWFYDTAFGDGRLTVGAAWPGFDDSLASWGGGRVQEGRCGRQLADTLAIAEEKAMRWGRTLPLLQLETWNDYEEGSAIEQGVDGCVTVAELSVTHVAAGDEVSWSVEDPEGWVTRVEVYRAAGTGSWVRVATVSRDTRSFVVARLDDTPARYLVVAQAAALLRNGVAESR